jgi:hypothetical protein
MHEMAFDCSATDRQAVDSSCKSLGTVSVMLAVRSIINSDFWVVTPCSPVEVYRLHGNDVISIN